MSTLSSPPPSDRRDDRQTLLWRALGALRSLSAIVELYTQATADRMGVNTTDVQCLNIIHELGTPTAGEVAAKTGLTSGSVTGVLDRLERAGYVERLHDPADRRRVRVRPTAKAGELAEQVFLPMLRAVGESYAGYSDDELRLFVAFLDVTGRALTEQTARLRADLTP